MISRIDFDDRKWYYDPTAVKDTDGLERYRSLIIEDLSKEKTMFFTLALHLRKFYDNGSYAVLHSEALKADKVLCTMGRFSAPVFFYACEKLFKLGKTTVKQLMRIPEEYAEDESGLSSRWEKYTYSQLVEMLSLTPEQREHVGSDWTIKQIREYRKSLEPAKAEKSQTSDLEPAEKDNAAADELLVKLDVVGYRVLYQCKYQQGTTSYKIYKKAVDDFIALMKESLHQGK